MIGAGDELVPIDAEPEILRERHRRLALHARARPLHRLLERALALRVTLEAHRQPRGVHHHEHVFEAAVRLADQQAERALVFAVHHHAGRAGVDAELVFDGRAVHVVARAGRAIGVDPELGHDEQRDAAHAGRRAVDARQHHVHDVLGEVVLAVGDEDLLAVEPVVRAGGRGARAHLREIAAGLRLGQVHGAGPLAAHHLRQVELLLLRRAEMLDGFDRALREHGAQLEGEVRRGPQLFDRGAEHGRHVLAAELGLGAQRRPAVFAELLVGVLVAFGHGHAVRRPVRAFAIAALAERLEHDFGEPRRFAEHGVGGFARVVGELRAGAQGSRANELIQYKPDVLDRCAVHHALLTFD